MLTTTQAAQVFAHMDAIVEAAFSVAADGEELARSVAEAGLDVRRYLAAVAVTKAELHALQATTAALRRALTS